MEPTAAELSRARGGGVPAEELAPPVPILAPHDLQPRVPVQFHTRDVPHVPETVPIRIYADDPSTTEAAVVAVPGRYFFRGENLRLAGPRVVVAPPPTTDVTVGLPWGRLGGDVPLDVYGVGPDESDIRAALEASGVLEPGATRTAAEWTRGLEFSLEDTRWVDEIVEHAEVEAALERVLPGGELATVRRGRHSVSMVFTRELETSETEEMVANAVFGDHATRVGADRATFVFHRDGELLAVTTTSRHPN